MRKLRQRLSLAVIVVENLVIGKQWIWPPGCWDVGTISGSATLPCPALPCSALPSPSFPLSSLSFFSSSSLHFAHPPLTIPSPFSIPFLAALRFSSGWPGSQDPPTPVFLVLGHTCNSLSPHLLPLISWLLDADFVNSGVKVMATCIPR